jgi:hypothetical protein
MDAAAVSQHAMGIAISSAAKNKLVGLLTAIQGRGSLRGEVMVYGTIKGTPSGDSTSIDPVVIAQEYWRLYQARSETRAAVKGSGEKHV